MSSDDVDASSSSSGPPSRPTPEGKFFTGHGQADPEPIAEPVLRAQHPRLEELDLEDERQNDELFRLKRDHGVPELDIPGFGEKTYDDCGEYCPAAFRFCEQSGKTHEFKRNCRTYDCPLHAPYAVRRRAAGDESLTGIAPKLKTLKEWLYWARDKPGRDGPNHFYHHLVVDIADEYITRSDEPLKRLVGIGGHEGVLPQIMYNLGVQGALLFHPYRFENEEPGEDGKGDYKEVVFHHTDIDDTNLEYDPHFHIIGVAPHVDISITEPFQEMTGWPFHRIQDKGGYSIRGDPTDPNDNDEKAMARALTYCLSHAGIYETDQQRRLCAWMKGPDIDKPNVWDSTKKQMGDIVQEAAEDTLGIASADLECDCDYHAHHDDDLELVDDDVQEDVDGSVSMQDLWEQELETAPGGTGGDDRDLGLKASQELPYENRIELPNQEDVVPDREDETVSSSSSSSRSSRSEVSENLTDDRDEQAEDDVDDDVQECGARLLHISKARDKLKDASWYIQAPYADELLEKHVLYENYMRDRGLDPDEDGKPTVPEADLEDDPPPD